MSLAQNIRPGRSNWWLFWILEKILTYKDPIFKFLQPSKMEIFDADVRTFSINNLAHWAEFSKKFFFQLIPICLIFKVRMHFLWFFTSTYQIGTKNQTLLFLRYSLIEFFMSLTLAIKPSVYLQGSYGGFAWKALSFVAIHWFRISYYSELSFKSRDH